MTKISIKLIITSAYFKKNLQNHLYANKNGSLSLSLDDHTWYFDTPCDGCTQNIVDGNDVVVYAIVIQMRRSAIPTLCQ